MKKALSDVVSDIDFSSYELFRQEIDKFKDSRFSRPFKTTSYHRKTGSVNYKFLSYVRVANFKPMTFSDKQGNVFSKEKVFSSDQFIDYLKKYCKTTLKGEVVCRFINKDDIKITAQDQAHIPYFDAKKFVLFVFYKNN